MCLVAMYTKSWLFGDVAFILRILSVNKMQSTYAIANNLRFLEGANNLLSSILIFTVNPKI